MKNTLNPVWKPWSIKLSKIAPDGDFFLDVLIKVWDWNRRKRAVYLGEIMTWVAFAGSVCAQAAVLRHFVLHVYLLTDDILLYTEI